MAQYDFDFDLKPRRPWWKDVLIFVFSVGVFWGGGHVLLNYDAFAQVAEYKYENLKASVLSSLEKPENTEPLFLEKVETTPRQVFRNKNLKPRNQVHSTFENMEVYPSDNRLYISEISKNVPLITVPNHKSWQELERKIQEGLRNGVVVHPISHEPNQFGNFFLTGHSSYYTWDKGRFKDVFALLHEVEIGDMVEVFWEGKKYTYVIQEKKVVEPTDVDVLNQPRNRSILTLMTCTPIGTNKKRLIVVGELVEE